MAESELLPEMNDLEEHGHTLDGLRTQLMVSPFARTTFPGLPPDEVAGGDHWETQIVYPSDCSASRVEAGSWQA